MSTFLNEHKLVCVSLGAFKSLYIWVKPGTIFLRTEGHLNTLLFRMQVGSIKKTGEIEPIQN